MITEEQLWNDPQLIKSLLSNLYNRLPTMHGNFNTGGMSEIDDAMFSGTLDQNWRNDFRYGDDYGRYWDYGLIRDINLSLENIESFSTQLREEDKLLFNAELRFLRAYVYFELVKRMGGVPLVTKQLIYDFGGDPSYLQVPRSKEHEIYDFIYAETEYIKDQLASNNRSNTRANTYVALALQSRAMLYAASTAKYNGLMSEPIFTEGGEVGIPASMANDYYQKSLIASKAIIANTGYELYNNNPDKGENFYDMLNTKANNKEVIFVKDYITALKTHGFAFENIARSLTEDNEGSSCLSPSISLIESFDYLDGSKGILRDKDVNGDYILYDKITDIFANKDARLYGTVIYPGTTFKGKAVDILAGVAIWEAGEYRLNVNSKLGEVYEDGGAWTGLDGPVNDTRDISNTGFYIRKHVSNGSMASARGTLATNWWPTFRLGEIYLNAAEAAFELNQSEATGYINALRVRAGFPENSITTLTTEIIRNERRVELAFEDHRYFDLKRWRISDTVWNGSDDSETAVVRGLYPYRVIRPGHADNGKFIFVRMRPTRFRQARFFRPANYYASIDQGVINNNPKIVRNPFH